MRRSNLRGAFEVYLLTPLNALDLLRRAQAGSPAARGTIKLIDAWLDRPDRGLCANTDCDIEFRDGLLPLAFAVAVPFAAERGLVIVSGICPLCVLDAVDGGDLGGLKALVMQIWRQAFGLREIEGGNA